MSYSEVLPALHTVFAGIGTGTGQNFVPAIKVLCIGEPLSVQDTPLLYSEIESFEREYGGTLVRVTYRTVHRLCVPWLETEAAETSLLPFVDSIPAAVDTDSKLGGNAHDASIVQGDSGIVSIEGDPYRFMDFVSEVLVLEPPGAA